MLCRICMGQIVEIQPLGNMCNQIMQILLVYTATAWQHELGHKDKEYIDPQGPR